MARSVSAEAQDAQGNPITSGITWKDSIQGVLGTGASISATLTDACGASTRLETATVTPPDGQSASDTIPILLPGAC